MRNGMKSLADARVQALECQVRQLERQVRQLTEVVDWLATDVYDKVQRGDDTLRRVRLMWAHSDVGVAAPPR